ncbi:hypothetical protein P7H15_11045 [Paenibacillus larvae]|nr:hypothetical protein [Paenibacillus larvae]MDT2293272.1 hypothetical protein [Paenibacillus larvae]
MWINRLLRKSQSGLDGGITYIPTDEGWLYLASLEDLCTRKDRRVSHGRAGH